MDAQVDEVTICKYEVVDWKKPIAWICYIGEWWREVMHQLPTKTTSRNHLVQDQLTWNEAAIRREILSWQQGSHSHGQLADSKRQFKGACKHGSSIRSKRSMESKPMFAHTLFLTYPQARYRGFWAHLRAHVGKNHNSDENLVSELVHACQFTWWCSGTDPMAKLGATMPKHLHWRCTHHPFAHMWVGPTYAACTWENGRVWATEPTSFM